MFRLFILSLFISLSCYAGEIVVKSSLLSPKTLENRLVNILKSKGVKIFAVIDHQKAAKKAGFNIPYEKVFIFGKPKVGTVLIKENPQIGLELPLKVLIYKKGEKSYLVYKDPKSLSDEFKIKKNRGILEKLSKILDEITNQVVKVKQVED